MGKEIATATFDYKQVDDDTRRKLICLSGQVKRHEKDFVAAGMEIGEAISEAHKLLAGNGRDGMFKQWVELETGLSRSSAYEWKNAYERAKKCPVLDTYSSSVACLLAAPTVPDEAIKDFAKQIDKGVKPTVAAAKATIERFRDVESKQPTKPKPSPPTEASDNTDTHGTPVPPRQPAQQPKSDDDPINGGKLFAKCLEHIRLALLCMEDLKKIHPSNKFESALNSLDLANQDICEWKRSAKTRR